MNDVRLALSYAASKIPVFPCRPADEETGEHDPDTGELIVLLAKTPMISNGFKGATTNERVIRELWKRNPGAMVGIPTGEQLGAWVLDVDVRAGSNGFETLRALEEAHAPLPDTACAQTAGGGRHYYFKHEPGVRNRGALGVGLDVRGSGGYVIAPGSKTADGRDYAWLDFDGDGLPPILPAPDWLLEIVLPKKAVSTPYTGQAQAIGDNPVYVSRAVEDELSKLASAGTGNRNNQLIDSAYAIGQFVGAGALSESDARNELESIAKQWPNFPKSKGTISRALKDGSDNPRSIPAPSMADDTPIVSLGVLTQPRRISLVEVPAIEEEPEDIPEYKLEAVDDLEALTRPGGLVEDLIDWIVSSAEQPCRALAMAAVLPFVASLCGSRYSTGSRDTRPNIYTVALAESGFGKDHARSQIKRLLMSDHGVFEKYSGPERIMSASALREVLEDHQSVNCQIDEFGGFVRDITDRRAGSHQRAISTDLRDYYSASSTFFGGAAYRGTPAKKIYNPNLCLHGTSTPEQFWAALTAASAEDGLLPRLILFHITGEKPPTVRPAKKVADVPPYLLMDRMAKVAGIDVVEARSPGKSKKFPVPTTSSKQASPPHAVKWTEDAEGIFRAVKATIDTNEALAAPESRPFMRRIIENAIKLALIVAVGRDPDAPLITEEVFEWAAAVAWTCAASMLAEVGDRLADNQREANYKKIAGLIRKSGHKGITEGRLFDRCKAIDGWQKKEILDELRSVGSVVYASNDNKTGPKTKRLMWVSSAA